MRTNYEQQLDVMAVDESGLIWRANIRVTIDTFSNMVVDYETTLIQSVVSSSDRPVSHRPFPPEDGV